MVNLLSPVFARNTYLNDKVGEGSTEIFKSGYNGLDAVKGKWYQLKFLGHFQVGLKGGYSSSLNSIWGCWEILNVRAGFIVHLFTSGYVVCRVVNVFGLFLVWVCREIIVHSF